MTRLFRRSARIVVDTIELVALETIGRAASLDVQFSIERSLKPEPNVAEIRVWNLNSDHRSQLEELATPPVTKNKKPQTAPPKGVPCSVEAGYEGATAQLFVGTLRTIYTTREGPDLVTILHSGDAEKEYQRSRINISIAPKTSNKSVMQQIQRALSIGEGNLNSIQLPTKLLFPQGGVLTGSASQIMTRIAQSLGLEWSIQEGVLQLLQVAEPLNASATLLTPATGLIGSPSVDSEGLLTAQALMIPDLFPGRLLVIESERLSGNYRIEKCNYSGVTMGTDWYVDVEARKL